MPMHTLKVALLSCFLQGFFHVSVVASSSIHKAYNLDLSNNAVLCMHQDNSGYMWVGTYDGLNLYNGKNVFVYRYEMDNENSLYSNIIHKITQADEDNIWVSTFLGLNKFSLKEKKVTESYAQCPEAKLLMSDSHGNTWAVCRTNYISYYTPETKNFIDIHLPGVSPETALVVFVDKKNQPCIVTGNGTLKQIQMLDKDLSVHDIRLDNGGLISAFYENGKIYIVNKNNTLYIYDVETNTKTEISDLSTLVNKYGRISEILQYEDNLYLSFNREGMVRLDATNNYVPETLSSHIGIFCMLKDKMQDLIWIGTDGQGIQMYYKNNEMFRNILSGSLPLRIQKPVRAIYTDEYDNLWMGTKGDGLIRIKKYTGYNNNPDNYNQYTTRTGLSNNSVFCFLRSEYRDLIWIGTDGPGLSFYSYHHNKVGTLQSDQIMRVHSICEVSPTVLWMATAGNGLLEVILEEKNTELSVKEVNEFFLKNGDQSCKEFHSMIYDGKQTLIVGSRGGYGVARFDIHTKQYDFIKMNKGENSAVGDVLCVHHSKDSIFYIGASSGITKLRIGPDGDTVIKQFDRRNGLANDMIHGILEAEDGCIWFSSNKGLIKYNPHNDFFHNYSYPELEVTEFSDDAYWKSPHTNRLFFGGINGLIWIEPDSEHPVNTYTPDLRFFDLKISGESYPIEKFMNSKGVIELPAQTHSFTISFVALDYINGDNYEYSYLLGNYNTEWVELQKHNEVTFTNLPSGSYTLKVRYKNDVFGSEDKYYTLSIVKLAPWYLTKWAVLLYIIFFISLVTYISLWIRNKINRRQIRIMRKIKEEEKEKLMESKLEFFTNVTHEFCTPLTVINGVTEQINKVITTDEARKYTEVLQNNVSSLNELIQEILDFRKIEASKFEAKNIRRVLISRIMNKHLDSFASIVEQNNIRLQVSIPEKLEWNTDTSCFNRILLNLISNAFKYTNQEGEIRISVAIENEQLVLKVYNTGAGIEESKIPYIFDRYRILESLEPSSRYSQRTSRNGIGLSICHSMVQLLQGEIKVHSKVNEFTEFIVSLPMLETTLQGTDEVSEPLEQVILTSEDIDRQSDKPKHTILVIDDNKDIVWLIQNTLSDSYTVKGVYNGEEALKFLEMETPALIITDIMMPGIDGLELIDNMKANKFARHIPIIVVSAKISDKEQAKGIDIGADAYLTKPFSPIVLSSLVKRILAKKEELKEYYYSPESAYEYSSGTLLHQDDKDFVDAVIAIIEENIEQENLRPELIADKLGINTRGLYRRFKKITSSTPNDFIKDYRFKLAAQLLVTTNLTTQEVIYKIGITNKSYFYREFVKKYNVTPKEYRSEDFSARKVSPVSPGQ